MSTPFKLKGMGFGNLPDTDKLGDLTKHVELGALEVLPTKSKEKKNKLRTMSYGNLPNTKAGRAERKRRDTETRADRRNRAASRNIGSKWLNK